jgi:hypothetical protein
VPLRSAATRRIRDISELDTRNALSEVWQRCA